MVNKLYPHQQNIVDTAPNRWALWLKMRVGKTPTAIRLASTRAKSAIVICPKSIRNQWEREIEVWNDSDCEFHVRSKEDIRLKKNIPLGIEAIIFDEVHMAGGNFKSKTFKSLIDYLKVFNCKYIWLLTGTPVSSGPWNVFSYKKLLGHNPNWYNWKKKYFDEIPMGHRTIPVAKKGMDEELQNELRAIGTIIDLKDITYVPDDENIIETFSLNPEQKRLIKDNFDPLPIVRYTKQHQIESGVLKSDGYTDSVSIDVEKDKRLVELVEQNDRIVIVCRYLDQIAKYLTLLAPLGRNIYQIHGQIKQQGADIALEAQNDPSAIVIVQGDTCVGYSLKNFNFMVFASLSYSFVNYDQMKSRLKAMGKTTPNTYVHFLTDDHSVDEGIYNAVQLKKDFDIELFNKQYGK